MNILETFAPEALLTMVLRKLISVTSFMSFLLAREDYVECQYNPPRNATKTITKAQIWWNTKAISFQGVT